MNLVRVDVNPGQDASNPTAAYKSIQDYSTGGSLGSLLVPSLSFTCHHSLFPVLFCPVKIFRRFRLSSSLLLVLFVVLFFWSVIFPGFPSIHRSLVFLVVFCFFFIFFSCFVHSFPFSFSFRYIILWWPYFLFFFFLFILFLSLYRFSVVLFRLAICHSLASSLRDRVPHRLILRKM